MSDLIRREDVYAAIRSLAFNYDRIAAIRAIPAVTVQAQIDAAVKAERERCARIAKTKWLTAMDDLDEWGIGNADREMNLSYITEAAIRKGDQP